LALLALLALLLLVALVTPQRAQADGDPASDYLWTQSVYVPVGTSPTAREQLRTVVDAARKSDLPIKVAVIASAYDLGSITPLWHRPQTYAQFLGTELSNGFHGLVIVAMPNGFGVYHAGRPVTSELHALRSLQLAGGASGLLAAAAEAVRSIAAVDGHPITQRPTAPATASHPSSGVAAPAIAAAIAGLLVLIGLAVAGAARRRRHRRGGRTSTAVPDVGGDRIRFADRVVAAGRLRAVLAVLGVLIVVAAIADARTFGYLHWGSGPPASSAAAAVGIGWPAGRRPAPPFTLRDQDGRPVTPRAGGRSLTILAFVDPVCRALCPLEAAVLGNVERALPAASRPAIVAVSVNPWGNAHANLVRDIRQWRTGPSWKWAIGPRPKLESVWRAYQVGVLAKLVRVAGTTVHEMTHDEMIYVIDGAGYERVVWPWPFTTAELLGSIRRLQAAAS
jgi:cytochrome oxidase Cu insertion factor (SCO1/SenC/PrrC family)